ncbi:MAG: hypothetical protein AAGA92_07280 [Planctomycetota bacterium]
MLYLCILLGFVLFGGIAMTVGEGLWSNTITFFVITFSGLLGVFAGVPLGVFAMEKTGKEADFGWYFIFAGMWLTFALSVTILRLLADRGSKVRMRFIPQLEAVGGPLMGLLVAVMFVSFATYTLERVPFRAGEWDRSKASSWQNTMLQTLQRPFYNVVKPFARSEGVDHPFLGKS